MTKTYCITMFLTNFKMLHVEAYACNTCCWEGEGEQRQEDPRGLMSSSMFNKRPYIKH